MVLSALQNATAAGSGSPAVLRRSKLPMFLPITEHSYYVMMKTKLLFFLELSLQLSSMIQWIVSKSLL